MQTLATLGSRGESLPEVAHDARNMVTALGLYCDLLEEPGVLAIPFAHYSSELRLIAAASRRLVEKLVALEFQLGVEGADRSTGADRRTASASAGFISLAGRAREFSIRARRAGSFSRSIVSTNFFTTSLYTTCLNATSLDAIRRSQRREPPPRGTRQLQSGSERRRLPRQ
jgi:hypothetical protein